MVWQLAAAAGIQAVSAIVQAYNAEKARGANAKRLKELRQMFEQIVPPKYDISIDDPPDYIQKQLPQADLDFSKLTPEQFKVVGTYAPKAAEYIAEQNPQLLKGSAAQKEGRQAQIDALRSMQSVAKGENPELAINLQRAKDSAQAAAQSRQQSILQDAQRRGVAGSGLSLAAALTGAGQSMAEGANSSQNAALAAYRDKLAAIQNAGNMGRALSQDELGMEQSNNDVINQFNQRTSRNYQNYLNQRAQMENDAQLRNLQAAQDISNRNVLQNNEYDRWNLENHNRLAQQAYSNARDERNYQNSIREKLAAWQAQQHALQNQYKRDSYQDQLGRYQGMAGLSNAQSAMATQGTQDRNAMFGGLANAGAGYYTQQAQHDAWKEAQDREDARWQMRAAMNQRPKNLAGADEDELGYRNYYSNFA